MSTHEDRLKALREELARRKLDGFVVPLTDEHMSEYVGAYAQRLAWLTGFQGSAGSAVVLPAEAAIFVDGRYTLQVREQVDGKHWSYQSVPQTSVAAWLEEHAPGGGRIGYDPWLHTKGWVTAARKALAAKGAELVAVDTNPVDAIWPDRPAPSKARLVVQPDELTGKSSAAKRADIADWLTAKGADAAVLSALDSIAWAFNIRGQDVDRTPVALAYAVVHDDATADLYVAPDKIDDAVRAHLGNGVRLHDRAAFESALRALDGKTVAADPERAVAAIFEALEAGGARLIEERDPVVLPKAIKNPVEIAGHKAAQARDGAALSRFLHWLSVEAPKGGLDEIQASDKLQALRAEGGLLKDLSFDTISGAGPNGAVVHYRASDETKRVLEPNSLYLVDSGGQYQDGTTDVTRTVAIGTPTQEMRDRYTRVLKGHVAIARAVFPHGTRGGQLDILARQYLWAAGLDYAHGTGHGVGAYLSVHEGPQRIATFGGGDEPLQPGMILSNEPGYYKAGEYGIRIENLILTVPMAIEGAEKEMLGFETLTFAPYERALIDTSMLDAGEIAWIDAYHAQVRAVVGPQLDGDAAVWLRRQTTPLLESGDSRS
ncbi:M24 family metallopeptidase [Sphingomonas histidinilytica]|uniref:Xaa-Pro aminopeptidase n=1 Tax=Rhizorhabdus histidinilytica TaxID=439228 RepID=A0A1T5BM59_9SPHN|nr:aminopeptidase P family protein [Rhizorhabdus histidinilytica]MBO9377439.1 M24 family metallopeptidase [Rhizorhabdus histidinilytica]SKB48205.1 Xaa-Pro aminopeptidase [Rhizorhabdus histidinilytica]